MPAEPIRPSDPAVDLLAVPIVIVGAGHVGGRAAAHLRELGWAGDIVLIGNEAALPYERPPLSKAVLTGEMAPERTTLLSAEAIAAQRITHVIGEVEALDAAQRQVTLRDGRSWRYRTLLLATGGRARQLNIPGATLDGVCELRTQADAIALAPRLQPGARIALIGGGFIGLEVAASACARGCRVTLIEGAPRLMGRAVPASIAERVLALHRRRGVDVRIGLGPTQFERTADGSLRVTLADASTLDADVIVVGIGIVPSVELARAAGLRIERGIVVNTELQTSEPGIYAAGDVAEFPSALNAALARQETWHNAESQARTAAVNLLGGHEAFATLPWFWSDQHDWQLQVSGEPALAATSVLRLLGDDSANPDADPDQVGELHFYLDADGRLVGASGCGPTRLVAKELKLARTLVERGARPGAAQLADPGVKLKALLSA
ncbi:MAG: NAD(P)/FAD-dependent oxidoreductase [Leptothrix sp. (in: b-proteobacteria)]